MTSSSVQHRVSSIPRMQKQDDHLLPCAQSSLSAPSLAKPSPSSPSPASRAQYQRISSSTIKWLLLSPRMNRIGNHRPYTTSTVACIHPCATIDHTSTHNIVVSSSPRPVARSSTPVRTFGRSYRSYRSDRSDSSSLRPRKSELYGLVYGRREGTEDRLVA